MQIVLDDNMSLSAVRELFEQIFPYLRIEFYEVRQPNVRRIVRAEKRVGMYKQDSSMQDAVISSISTVAELEKDFSELYGLHVMVFRKSGNVWLQTTVTDSWTLEEQNRQGEMLTAQFNKRTA